MRVDYKLGKRSLSNLVGVHPILGFAVTEAIKITKQDFGIVNRGGVRTDEEQQAMYNQGRLTEGNKVTWTLNSFHQYGLAVDLVAYVRNEFTWDEVYYEEIVNAMKEVIELHNLPIQWGFDLWQKDLPHWQITELDGTDAREVYDIRKLRG